MNTTHEVPVTSSAVHSKGLDANLLESLRDINDHCIEVLIGLARAPPDSGSSVAHLVDHLRDALCAMSVSARNRAAQCPFLLVDMEFRDLEWWHAVSRHPEKTWKMRPWLPSLPRRSAVQLARTALMFAWHTARINREAAIVFLGIAPAVATTMASMHLRLIDRIADRHYQHLRPRWEDRPAAWKQLLQSAQSGDASSMYAFHLRGLQLLSSESIPNR
jgi:hypothetical protein